MQATRNAIDWFEIPVRDMGRAAAFYEALLATSIRVETLGNQTLGVFAYDETGTGGCLIAGAHAPMPAASGTLVHLNAGASLDAVLARVERLGGRITTPRTTLPGEMGCFAHIADLEGNRVGLHAPM